MFKSSMLRMLVLAIALAAPTAQNAFAQQEQQAAVNSQSLSTSAAISTASPYNAPQPTNGD